MFRIIATAICAVLTAFDGPAEAQARNCGDHNAIIEQLADRWGEGRVAYALAANGALVETFANLETGTWTVVLTAPAGPTCLVAAGTEFTLTPGPAGEES